MIASRCIKCSKEFSVKPYRKDIAKYCSYFCYWGKSTDLAEKKCNTCNTILSTSCFGKKNRGWESSCKECRRKHFKNWARRNNPKQRLRFYQWNSKRNGREFSISEEEFIKLTVGNCYYCGRNTERLGLDRVDSGQGYTMKNVVPCCRRCNVAKSDMVQSDFIDLCRLISQNHA